MDDAWQEKVRERAYTIWEREGCPEGQAEQFWLAAEAELRAEGQGPTVPPAAPAEAETSGEGEPAEGSDKTMGGMLP